ncbi:hypothetical protein CSB11_02425 [Candidatus Campbellbacteria bacterium]|nr:MAG: hypothetical protein CSB11_02425 [Candidatus Campbellbacteria bacterium]
MPLAELIFYYLIIFFPFVLLIYLIKITKDEYFKITARENDISIERVMYEIKIPKEVTKTPLAMEMVFSALYNGGGESRPTDVLFKGKRRHYYSLEIVSDGGEIKFYIWTPKALVKVVESAFYAQYPGVQLIEVQDYTKFSAFDEKKDNLFGIEYKLSKEDPYPIKTYRKFGLESVGLKPEEVTDPMSHIIEVLSNIGPGEKVWLQMVIRAHKKDRSKNYGLFDIFKNKKFSEKSDWKDEAKEVIEKIRNVEDAKSTEEVKFKRIDASKESDLINDIIENTSKPGFWAGIRLVYFADKEKFNMANAPALATIFSTLASNELNSIIPARTSGDDTKYLRKLKYKKENFFKEYKRRKFFHYGKIDPHYYTPLMNLSYTEENADGYTYADFVLSTEELATIFHLPTTTIVSPNFQREESAKGSAPANLPI